jgi:uncharacterized protein
LRTPSVFVSGTRDPFGSVPEMEAALKLIPARVRFLTVEGAGHDLNFKKTPGGQLVPLIVATFLEFFREG